LQKIGIKTSKWNIRKNGKGGIYIGGKEHIRRYIEIINFKNQRHLNNLLPP
jgi:hypothetical protein